MNYMKKVLIVLASVTALLMSPSVVLCQYDYTPFTGKPNPGLVGRVRSGKVGSLFAKWGYDGMWEQWATSFRKAEGQPPRVKPVESDDGESQWAYLAWRGMYSAYCAQDKNPKTAWIDGMPGDGVGEMVVVRINTRKPVRIWAGFGKSLQAFRSNNRPKGVRVYVLEGKLDQDRSAEGGEMISNIRVVAKSDLTLKDMNGYQPLRLPKHTIAAKNRITLLAIEILSVYPGSKYKDTCISEVGN